MMRTSEYFVDRTEETLNWLIAEYGLTMPDGSPIRIIYDLMREERERCSQYGVAVSGEMTTTGVRGFFGLSRFCDRIAQIRAKKTIPATFADHIRLLDIGIPSQTSRYEDICPDLKKQEVKQASDSLFELTVALAALTKYDQVEIEPLGGTGIPDVCIDINGVRWGFECKVSDRPSPKAHYRIVKKGIKQLNANINAGVIHRGCVILSVQNVLSRNERPYASDADVKEELKKRHNEFSNNVQMHFSKENINELYQESSSEPGVIAYFEDVFLVVKPPEGIIAPKWIRSRKVRGQILFTPWAYAQHTTFDGSGLLPDPVVDTMLKALSGPNTLPMDVL